ncbi:MAG: hypothetical protein J1F10_06575, partial [Muribaculaceae bacterium]|nr:hypothetical protein [Muribaculaceae bacterium]
LYINLNVLRPDSIIDMMELDKSVHFYYYPVLLLSLITIFYIPYSTKKIFTFRISRKSLPDGNRIYRSFQENVTTNVMRSLLIICFVVAMAGWIYFFILYNSANINTFDRVIFTGVPILVALIHSVTLSIIFLSYIYHKDLLHRVTPYIPNKSILRFIIVSDDNLLLQLKNDGTYDTPVVITIPFSENIDLSKLEEILNEKYNINPKSIKLLFSKDDKSFNSNINLYLCKVDKDAKVSIPNNLAWITTSQLENINSERKLSVLLNNELYRIFGTMLAYKEFDEDGNCRYKVKGYHPTVTIADISRYDIDYNDNKWMTLFSINHSKSLISKLRLIRYKYFKTSIH